MCAEQGRIQANASDPLREQARILAGREAATWTPTAGEQEIAGVLAVGLEVIIDRLAGLLGDLELDRLWLARDHQARHRLRQQYPR